MNTVLSVGNLSVLGGFCMIIGFIGFALMFLGFFIAFFGSAMGNRDAIPGGIIVEIIGLIIFCIPFLIGKLFS